MDRLIWPNEAYLAELYERFRRDPGSVGSDVRRAFETWAPAAWTAPSAVARTGSDTQAVLGVARLAQAIREHGHLAAAIDPLSLWVRDDRLLDPASYGLSAESLALLSAALVSSPADGGAGSAEQAISRLREVYRGSTGYEFAHLASVDERSWLQQAVESGTFVARLDAQGKRRLLHRLLQVEALEHFLHRTFPGQHWFSVEGTDAFIPLLDTLTAEAMVAKVEMLVLGMAHRGRLNALAHVLNVPYQSLFMDFRGSSAQTDSNQLFQEGWTKDVQYHRGAERRSRDGGTVEFAVTLLPNPSHLEMVNPVVLGAVRAAQESDGREKSRHNIDRAAAILVHGDASFAGQGIVAETMNLHRLEGYQVGGTIHVVINNRIGFTAEPRETHSTQYATDVARGFNIPVVHVNADDVEACLSCARLAFAFRNRFHGDFVIDLVGYRRHGHNESDDPTLTQPEMYEAIRNHPSVQEIMVERLVREGVVTPREVTEQRAGLQDALKRALASLPEQPQEPPPVLPADPSEPIALVQPPTTVGVADLKRLNDELLRLPVGFTINPRLERPLARRGKALDGERGIDWGHAETLAFASLLAEGMPIRLSGQDSERGTFSHRHAVLHDYRTGEAHVPLQAMPSARAQFMVYNSPLSEEGVLAYEYGYSLQAQGSMVIWEAQFGDFINNAQAIIEEFVVSARAKWGQRSGLTLLLPHGYEGQGPDHSNADLERFLQLAAEQNIQVAFPTTAAQYFHLLRRQAAVIRATPHPLVVMTGKSLLRHPAAMATAEELAEGSFQPVISDARIDADGQGIRRLILCTGKVYMDLSASEEYAEAGETAVVRVEQLYPLPKRDLAAILDRCPNLDELCWVQEEPRNRGAWAYMAFSLEELMVRRLLPLRYVGRPARSSPAEGTLWLHRAQQRLMIEQAFAERQYARRRARGVTP